MFFYFCSINSFPNKPWFLRVCSTSVLKTLREKEKLLVSFSHSVSYMFEGLSKGLKLSSANSFNFEEFKIVVWERVN